MPVELASIFVRRSVGSLSSSVDRCSSCRRAPLAGELLHELETGRVVCQLCLARLPASKRETVGSERVLVGERKLAVFPRAA